MLNTQYRIVSYVTTDLLTAAVEASSDVLADLSGTIRYNPPFSGLRAASTWEAVGFCGSHRQTDVLAKLSSWLGG